MTTVFLSFLFCALAFAQPAPPPLVVTASSFLQDVYASSIYGDVVQLNPMYWGGADASNALARRLNATPMQKDSTPQTGPPLTRWHVSEIANKSMLPQPGMRLTDPSIILAVVNLPAAKMWAEVMQGGCVVNAGYLLDYFRRNPEAQFPGDGKTSLAMHYVQQVIAGECAQGIAKKKVTYPSIWKDGKERKR